MIDLLNRALAPLRTRIVNMVARAVVQIVDDSTKMQLVQIGIADDENRTGIERFQNYGFSSVPFSDAEAVVLFVGGRRDHGLAIAVDDRRYRIRNLESGEVAVYTDQGDSIVIKRGGNIEVTASTQVTVSAPVVTMSGNLIVTGNVAAATVSASAGISGASVAASGAISGASVSATSVTATTVTASGKSLSTHTHSGVTTGAGTSGPPS